MMISFPYVYHIFLISVRTLVITKTRKHEETTLGNAVGEAETYAILTTNGKVICWEILLLWNYSSTWALKKKLKILLPYDQHIL